MPTDSRPGLVQLLPGLKPEDFMERYWCQKHYACHASPDRLADLFRAPALESINSLLNHVDDSVQIRNWFTASTGKLTQLVVNKVQARTLYQTGKITVVLDHVDLCIPEVNNLLDGLRRDVQTPMISLSCNAYASPVGAGTRMHFDEHEVFLLQLRGCKKWSVAPMREFRFPRDNHNGGVVAPIYRRLGIDFPEQMPADAEEVVLEPGSVLYMPRGTWHASEACHEDSLALTLALDSMTPLDALLVELAERLCAVEELRRPLVGHAARGTSPKERDRMASVLSALKQQVAGLDVDQLLAVIDRTHRQVMLGKPGSLFALKGRLWTSSTDGAPKFSFTDASSGEDVELEVDSDYAQLVSWIAGRERPFSPADIPPPIQRDAEAVCKLLLENGVLESV